MCPYREELSVSFCCRGNYIQAALGMTCPETYEAIAFACRKKKGKEKVFIIHGSCQWHFLLPSTVHLKGSFVLFIGKWQLLLQESFTPHVVSTCLHFSTGQQREERGLRTRVKAGQSLMRERSESLLVWTLSIHIPTITRAEGRRAGK